MRLRRSVLVLGGFFLMQACGATEEPISTPPAPIAESEQPIQTETVTVTPDITSETPEAPIIRQAASHVHGDAALAIVLENSVLTIELETPLYNLTGFEHAPETEEQLAVVKNAEARLNTPGELFSVNTEAGCDVSRETHDFHLSEESHEDHGHEADSDDADEHTDHKDVLITYEFACETPDKIKSLSTTLLAEFPNMTAIDVVYLGPNSQKAYTLTPESNRVQLGQ